VCVWLGVTEVKIHYYSPIGDIYLYVPKNLDRSSG
jgi:hypothetical protein